EVGAFFATPQVVENDIINDRIDLDEFALVIFDEVHRATGDYPYTFIAESYHRDASDPHVLGLTASPGSDRDQIERVADNLGFGNVEARTADDPDVEPYVEETTTNWVKVSLDRNFERVKKQLEAAERKHLNELKDLGLLDSIAGVQKQDLLNLRGELGARIKEEDDPALYQGMSHVAACMKVEHALELLETQGVKPLYRFLEKMEKDPGSKAAKRLLDDDSFRNAMSVAEWMVNNGKEHPKLAELKETLAEKMDGTETAIVFTQYRDTVDLIHDELARVEELRPVKFKGQKDEFTQQRQIEILDEFRDGDHNVL
ncbi:MAG: DEAD/DEAH box helicase family protein, partial [Candidatus Nanohaloarchaea archaeon]